MANDADPNGDDLLITGFSSNSLQGGAIARDGNRLRYTPADGFRGNDSFRYSIGDSNGGTSSAIVNITVPNTPPVATDDFATVELGTSETIEVLANDRDPNGDDLLITGFSSNSLQRGAIARDGNRLRYTPADGFRGNDSFRYSIGDGNGGTSSAIVNITVPNAPPVATDDFATVELGTSETIEVLANDRDPNGDDLLITGFSSNSLQGGAIARDGNRLRYTPADGFRGNDSFRYSIGDGNGGTSSAIVNITVPNAPPVATDDFATVELGTSETIEVLANDRDPNGVIC